MKIENIKQELLDQCNHYLDQRLQRIQNTIADIQESLGSETKSTAGDKHETGRAMLQLEREKAGAQLAQVQQLFQVLGKLDISTMSNQARLGSLVFTSQGNYFLSISVGKIVVDHQDYYAIATNSPLGKLLLGKIGGDRFIFNGNETIVNQIF